eukprot:1639332-Rhodomonas_salina.2
MARIDGADGDGSATKGHGGTAGGKGRRSAAVSSHVNSIAAYEADDVDEAFRDVLQSRREVERDEAASREEEEGHKQKSKHNKSNKGKMNAKKPSHASNLNDDSSDEDLYGESGPTEAPRKERAPPPQKKKVKYMPVYKERTDDSDDDLYGSTDPEVLRVALEEACAELGMTADDIVEMLKAGSYDRPLLRLVMAKTDCYDEGLVKSTLDGQRAPLLSRMEKLVRVREQAKSAEEERKQEKLKELGRCPLDFELKVEGGYQCAVCSAPVGSCMPFPALTMAAWHLQGGSHFITDEELGSA